MSVKTSNYEQPIYYCNICDYKCFTKYNYNRHLTTTKHLKSTNINMLSTENEQNEQVSNFECDICNKIYKERSGLWRHKQKCKIKENEKDKLIEKLMKENKEIKETNIVNKKDDMIEFLLKENKEIKELILEIVKNGTHINTVNSNNTNSNNKAFNLQFYLNETCKNAMNMSDFIDSINLQLSDLISVGELGYVDGISKIIIDNLNKLDFTERPVNCTDKKRDTIYIKDNNKWEKDEENKKLNKAVKKVAYKNTMMFPLFKQKYPDYNNAESIHSNQYSNIVIQSLDDSRENNEKVIKNISKVTAIKAKGDCD